MAKAHTPAPVVAPEAPEVAAPEAIEAPVAAPEKVWLRAVNSPMLNLHTNVWVTNDPKKVVLDDFFRAQIEAGKLVIADEE